MESQSVGSQRSGFVLLGCHPAAVALIHLQLVSKEENEIAVNQPLVRIKGRCTMNVIAGSASAHLSQNGAWDLNIGKRHSLQCSKTRKSGPVTPSNTLLCGTKCKATHKYYNLGMLGSTESAHACKPPTKSTTFFTPAARILAAASCESLPRRHITTTGV